MAPEPSLTGGNRSQPRLRLPMQLLRPFTASFSCEVQRGRDKVSSSLRMRTTSLASSFRHLVLQGVDLRAVHGFG